ncbi:MAG: hypothetical protein ACQER9_02930 [Nanobdellota archaeon]
MERKKIDKFMYLSAVFATVIIFFVGLMIGNLISEIKMQNIYDLENKIRVDSLSNELTFNMIEEDLCNYTNITSYTTEIAEIGNKLTYMEAREGYDSPQVKNLKSYYSLLLIRHYLINKEINEKCGVQKENLLYFYTNYEGCADCEDQGLVLSRIHEDYSDIMIYSFEYKENNSAVNLLKERYDVELHKLPTIVFKGKVYNGFQSMKDLKSIIEDSRINKTA